MESHRGFHIGDPVVPLTLYQAGTILTTIALLAGIFPAKQAAGVDPVETLHYE